MTAAKKRHRSEPWPTTKVTLAEIEFRILELPCLVTGRNRVVATCLNRNRKAVCERCAIILRLRPVKGLRL